MQVNRVYVRPMGGLGNQLFQYAVAYGVARKHSAQLIIDTRFFDNYELHGGFRLYNLNISVSEMTNADLKKFPEWKCKLLSKFPQVTRFFNEYIYDKVGDLNEIKSNDAMLLGYWQNETNFHQYKNELVTIFKPKIISENDNKKAESILATNSVVIHIRRGDYINNPIAYKHHGVCSLNYYKQAINEMKKNTKNIFFYIFSDDIEWCRENITPLFSEYDSFSFVRGETQEVDMWLMSCGKYHIIANSSFSWWGAFLSTNPDQIVIAPTPWFDITQKYTGDPSLPQWIKIDKY
ncbi:TPA: alpha-1,2-fucosyltransferase [Citrobacter freundii]|nr:alpha-1,2-fucosyltransferase [Citrobacter freundii]